MENFLRINTDKCVKCGACAEVCPVKIIRFEKDDYPENEGWARKACIKCGHCVAVCPAGALSLETITLEECLPVRDELQISEEQGKQLLRSRRSIREYKDAVVSKCRIEDLIDAARYAPSGHNFQPVKWEVIYDRNKVSELKDMVLDWMRISVEENTELSRKTYMSNIVRGCDMGMDLILRNAPHVVITYGDKEERTAEHSCRLAMTYLELAAYTSGLGACWAGFLDLALAYSPPIQKKLDLPEDQVSYCSMMLGYPKFTYHRIPPRNSPQIDWL